MLVFPSVFEHLLKQNVQKPKEKQTFMRSNVEKPKENQHYAQANVQKLSFMKSKL